ncbi:S8 family peptidase [Streptomyces sp. NPDC091027]|uniref:S8 family peptidase n=1 Tax=Streptomyces sp. NPDC091027 TaxID=3365971 RepID=UPI0038062CF2
MKRPLWAVVTATAAATALTAIPVDASPLLGSTRAYAAEPGPVTPHLFEEARGGDTVRVNVVTDRRTDLDSASAAGETLLSYDTLPLVTLRVDRAGLDRLNRSPGVVSVTEDVPVPPALNESTVRIGSNRTAVAGNTGAGTSVAILDTGVAVKHPFLGGRVKTEACFSVNDPAEGATSLCPNGSEQQETPGSADSGSGRCAALGSACAHGTHVAGIAAGDGTGLSGAPVRGVAPGADIIAIQVFSRLDSDTRCLRVSPCILSYTSSQIKALEKVHALKKAGVNVVAANLSFGEGLFSDPCADDHRAPIIDKLRAAGVATVVAAGNDHDPIAVNAPGCVPSAITVGSTTNDDQLSPFTNRGPLLDLLAPGTGIVSSVPGGGYAPDDGTSMAAPHVTGAFAVLKQAHPGKTVDQLEAMLKSDGKPLTYEGVTTARLQLGPSPVPGDMTGDNKPDLVAVDDTGNCASTPALVRAASARTASSAPAAGRDRP